MQNTKSTKTILLSYLSYLILFVGTAFISGAIVHVGNVSELAKYALIGSIGITFFITGSFIQEAILNKANLKEEGIVKFFFYSLLLSLGIGMISGGTQHYSDFPTYSSYFIPIGLVLSLIAYLLKNNYYITSKLWATIVGVFLLISLPLHFGLMVLANNLNAQTAKEKAELCAKKTTFLPFTITVQASVGSSHGEAECEPTTKTVSNSQTKTNNCPVGQSDKEMPRMCMPDDSMSISKPIVTDDKSFIEYVIPHHQDAVDGSTKVLATTQDPELKTFLSNVIKTQGQEISMLKGYYKTWLGKDYVPNNSYTAMMKFDGLTGVAIDKAYIQGMLGHHSEIIDVAKKVVASDLGYTFKPETIALSRQIIKDQEADNVVLNKGLVEKYNGVGVEAPHDESVPH